MVGSLLAHKALHIWAASPHIVPMTTPINVDLPHKLGKEEARRRIADNIGSLGSHLPAGSQVQHDWSGDTLNLKVAAMGQTVDGTIRVEESKVNVAVALGGLLGMMAAPIAAVVKQQGGALLEDQRKGG